MLRKLTELRVLKAIVDLSRDADNTDTDKIHFINDTIFKALNREETIKFTAIFSAYPGFTDLYKAPRMPRHDLLALSKLPNGTLGFEYARFMSETDFSIDWYPTMEEKSLLHYARNRLYQTHDILHTITGFWGGTYNEMALQGFYAGQQIPNATTMATIAGSSLNLLQDNEPSRNSQFFDYLLAGYQMGKNAEKVIFRNWEADFETDITTLRKQLNITSWQQQDSQ